MALEHGSAAGRGPRLHVVTGKGGTGKTTVAGALALALAGEHRKVLLVEVEGRQGIASLFRRAPLPYAEQVIARTPAGGEVSALAVDAEEALLEYLELFYRLGLAGRALRKVGAVDFATTIAPGLRDILLTGKVKEATGRTAGDRPVYDAVVLDAPPTGRIGSFLNVTAEAARVAKVGPIKNQSERVAALLRSELTAVHVVTLLEEMPVQESVDAMRELSRLRIPTGSVIINCAQPVRLVGAQITREEVHRRLTALDLPTDAATVDGLVAEARAHQRRNGVEAALRAELHALDRPVVELPVLPQGVNRDSLPLLSDGLAPLLTSAVPATC